MSDTTPAHAPAVRGLARPAVMVAAVGSAVAGLVHAAAAGNHQGDAWLVWMFAACAAARLAWGWAVAVAARPERPLLIAGLVINGGAVLVWAVSRTIGIGFIDSLAGAEAIGTQDLVAAAYAAASAVAIVCILVRPNVRTAVSPSWNAALAAFAFFLVLPALAAGHDHADQAHDHVAAGGDAAHEHAHSEETATDVHGHATETTETALTADDHGHGAGTPGTTTAAAAHGHTTSSTDNTSTESETHDHSSEGTTETTSPHEHPTTTTTLPPPPEDPITSLDDPRLTPDQVDRAIALIISTMDGMAGYLSEDDVVAAGYQSIGDGGHPGEYEHFVRWQYLSDGFTLDQGHIESIVLKMNADGSKRVVAAMYALTFGDTMADVPEIAGKLTLWHDHDNMCFAGDQFVGLATSGACSVGTFRDTPPMLHVWIEENPCGPFAVIDNEVHECTGGHHH